MIGKARCSMPLLSMREGVLSPSCSNISQWMLLLLLLLRLLLLLFLLLLPSIRVSMLRLGSCRTPLIWTLLLLLRLLFILYHQGGLRPCAWR